MNYIKLFTYLITITVLIACSVEDNAGRLDININSQEKNNVCIFATQSFGDGPSLSLSKTSIDTDYASTRWDKDDYIYVWATSRGSNSYVIENTKFGVHYYGANYNNAVFTGTVNTMSSGEYTYYGVYPKPKSISGATATYSVSAEQSGKYNGKNDIMVAYPIDGKELTHKPDDELNLLFRHLTHLIRIEIPSGRNHLGDAIKKLVIDFPQNVVGDLSFNFLNDSAKPIYSSTSKSVVLNFNEPLNESEEYIWLFVNPTTLKGDIKFTGYTNDGYRSCSISTNIDKTLKVGKITPIKLTIPEELPYTTLSLTMSANNLGEDYNEVTFTAPEGTSFRGGKNSITYPKNATNKYTLEYYHTEYGSTFKSKGIACEFESENAIVNNTLAVSSSINEGGNNSVNFEVPYLFYEDFSGINSSFEYGTEAGKVSYTGHYEIDLSKYNLTGWTGDRVGGSKEGALRSMSRLEGGAWVQVLYDGRIDSPPLSNIKEGKSINISVAYKYSGNKGNETNTNFGNIGTTQYHHGYTNKSGKIQAPNRTKGDAFSSGESIEHTIGNIVNLGTGGSYTNINNDGSYTTNNITNISRLSWYVTVNRKASIAQNGNYWLYIDKVAVKIKK